MIYLLFGLTPEMTNEFMQVLNSHDDSINLKSTISEESIAFLGVTIVKSDQFTIMALYIAKSSLNLQTHMNYFTNIHIIQDIPLNS